ncbi:hypothetical protein BDN72DRAFT_844772 [Pluteus cervinus]|uniref:Uncharacterized protein n=1 Tax=Pluteus cervinus TaxID=181527 RepID=A0ACD3AKF4_9AGAR|nr:hypothetical protein BDN72DRAFT_844772 [Pluteus cervinus]
MDVAFPFSCRLYRKNAEASSTLGAGAIRGSGDFSQKKQLLHPLFMLDQLPPEILARVFEIGILAWGISYLPPICIVCSAFNDVAVTEPRLWGIVTLTKDSIPSLMETQITKAKAAPLTVYVDRRVRNFKLYPVIQRLASLAENWVHADVPLSTLALCSSSDLAKSLLDLDLGRPVSGDYVSLANTFFGTLDSPIQTPRFKLRTFRAKELAKRWIIPFLSPQLVQLELCRLEEQDQALPNLFEILRLVPNIFSLKLEQIHYRVMDITTPPVHLPNLLNLDLVKVLFPSRILTKIQAPSLTTLSISGSQPSNDDEEGLSAFFVEWFQERFLPTHLHTLELIDAVDKPSIPYLIRWLSRLKRLVRLTVRDDEVGEAALASDKSNLFTALATPSEEYDGWLLPSLMELRLDTGEMSVERDLTPIARARGGIACLPQLDTLSEAFRPPGRLRFLEAPLCPNGFEPEIEEIKGLSDVVICGCLGCSMNLNWDAL